jgi:hypothetical protein
MDHVHTSHGQNILSNIIKEDILGLLFVNHCVLGGTKPKTLLKSGVSNPWRMDHVYSSHGQNILSYIIREDILGLLFVKHCVFGVTKPKTMYYWPNISALQ